MSWLIRRTQPDDIAWPMLAPFGRAMDAVAGVLAVLVDVERARAERIGEAAGLAVLPFHQFRLALDHFRRRRPDRPFLAVLDVGAAGPAEAVLADADAVADGVAALLHEIELSLLQMDDDGAGRLAGLVDDDLAAELRLDLLIGHRRHFEAAVVERGVHDIGAGDVLVDADRRADRPHRAGDRVVQLQLRQLERRRAAAGHAEQRHGAGP